MDQGSVPDRIPSAGTTMLTEAHWKVSNVPSSTRAPPRPFWYMRLWKSTSLSNAIEILRSKDCQARRFHSFGMAVLLRRWSHFEQTSFWYCPRRRIRFGILHRCSGCDKSRCEVRLLGSCLLNKREHTVFESLKSDQLFDVLQHFAKARESW